MFDRKLIEKINSGRCFALVGSGPSCEMGYPTWSKLASETFNHLKTVGKIKDEASYNKYFKSGKFAEIFKLAERDFGGRSDLIAFLKTLLIASPKGTSPIYNFLAKWPFACYLTTNYDNELSRHLKVKKAYFQTLKNSREDLYAIRDSATNLIVKLHGDLDYPDGLVLTSDDYQKFTFNTSHKYFQDKLHTIFQTFDIFIIGHSLYDSDINIVLQFAKDVASPTHPIYMIASDFTAAEQQEYLEKYNIVTIVYDIVGGSHKQLQFQLRLLDKFIVPREKRSDYVPDRPLPDEIEAATSLMIFQNLQATDHYTSAASEYILPLILQVLLNDRNTGFTLKEIIAKPPLKTTVESNREIMIGEVEKALIVLQQQGLVNIINQGFYGITDLGKQKILKINRAQEIERDQAYGEFTIALRTEVIDLSDAQEKLASTALQNALISAFRKRGLAIANLAFTGSSITQTHMPDIFEAISYEASSLDKTIAPAFMSCACDFLVNPTSRQQQYLSSLSQGYFIYHKIGLDPVGAKAKQEIFLETIWLFDTSVLLPLLAIDCYHHRYTVDMFQRLRSLNAPMCTTDKFLEELHRHLQWALDFITKYGTDSSQFYLLANIKLNYKQNLFVDGFINSASQGTVKDFIDYINLIFPDGFTESRLKEKIEDWGIKVLKIREIEGFSFDDWDDIETNRLEIETERQANSTHRSDLQVNAEAEVTQIIQRFNDGYYKLPNLQRQAKIIRFVSHSKMLWRLKRIPTWTLEALYRYLLTIPGKLPDPSLLQQCMLHEYQVAGVRFIDKKNYIRFFSSTVNMARLSYAEEKDRYLQGLEQTYNSQNLDDEFEKTPDLDKPFFVGQMGWSVAEKAEARAKEATSRAGQAEIELIKLRAQKSQNWKVKEERRTLHDEQTQRNLLKNQTKKPKRNNRKKD